MKHLGKLAVLGAVLAASASSAFATTITGYWWNSTVSGITICPGGICTGAEGAIPSPLPSTASATTTLSIVGSNIDSVFNFYSTNDSSLNAFLTSGYPTLASNGDTPAYGAFQGTSTQGTNNSTQGINNSLFEFNGSTTVSNGEVITTMNDDGVLLYINGISVFATSDPNSAQPTISSSPNQNNSCTVGGTGLTACNGLTAGSYNFELLYAESNGPSAQLDANLGVIPEPSSLMLLGTGLMGAAGMLFRRRQTV